MSQNSDSVAPKAFRVSAAILSGAGGTPATSSFLESEFHLVLFAQRPCFDPTVAQVARKFGRETVQRQHALRLDQIDISDEIVVIGVIGKRKCGVNLVAINCVRIDRPAADHRDAFTRDFFEHTRAICARRTDENFAGDLRSRCSGHICKTIGRTVRKSASFEKRSRAASG